MLGLTSMMLAAALAAAGAAQAQTSAPATTPTPAPATTAVTNPADGAAAANAAAPAAPAAAAVPADPTLNADGTPKLRADARIGQPIPNDYGLQEQVTPTGRQAHNFHNWVLLPLITFISLLVLGLLVWVIVRYRRAANPEPSKTAHNTTIEVIWTLIPVAILVAIAIPSIRLLAAQYKPAPENAITLKAIGNQWFWSYEYPDLGVSVTANMLKEKDQVPAGQRFRTDADGPRLLAVDNRIVLPVGVPIRLVTTATDVIHSWAVPAFWIKLDAIPGRLNETSFTIERPGLYFGQCSELCGQRHAFMPIAVEAVSPEVFAQWVRAKGGKMPTDAAAAAAPANATAVPPAPGNDTVDDTATPANGTGPVTGATATPASTNQAATANSGGVGQADQ